MTVALARRLVWDGVVASEEVNRALVAHVTRRVAFLAALVEANPGVLDRLDAELGVHRRKAETKIVPDSELSQSLPPGVARVLLAVPIGRDAQSGRIQVLVADPSDPHVESELAYHFGAEVELLPASARAILGAIAAVEPKSPLRSSEPPIPLVRVNTDGALGPTTVKGVAPQAPYGSSIIPSPVVVPGRQRAFTPEPVIQLTRPKSLGPPAPLATQAGPSKGGSGTTLMMPAYGTNLMPGPGATTLPAPGSPLTSAPAPKPAASSPVSSSEPAASSATQVGPESVELEFESAGSADEVAVVLARGLRRVARRVVVLALRGKVFEGRETGEDGTRAAARALVVSTERPSVLLTAVQTGQYVGPVPQTEVHRELHAVLGNPTGEIAVGVVKVSGRPALVYAAAGLDTPYLVTRRGDALVQAAGRRIERLVRDRKK